MTFDHTAGLLRSTAKDGDLNDAFELGSDGDFEMMRLKCDVNGEFEIMKLKDDVNSLSYNFVSSEGSNGGYV